MAWNEMYSVITNPRLDKIFEKLEKKNRKQLEIIEKKINEVVLNPHHYKHLKAPMQHLKRIHIDDHFVLTFSVDEDKKEIILKDYAHHDEIYL